MINLLLFYLFCQASSAEIHDLKLLLTGSSGLSNFPEFEMSIVVDGNSVVYCNGKILKQNYDWMDKFLKEDPVLSQFHNQCNEQLPNLFKSIIADLKENSKQTDEVHILQLLLSCDLDEKTEKVAAVLKFGYNGEDLIAQDLDNMTWIALQPQAIPIKLKWGTDKALLMFNKRLLTQMCPEWLKGLLDKEKDILFKTEHPSLSLLQKSPPSPVSCHATGFYPNRALMFWRKDGEEIHENVDHGEILPNHDGTFQMRVYLNISSISPEDWRRYDCVFQLVDKEENIIKLDEAVIRTNREKPSSLNIPIISAVITLVLVAIAAAAAAAAGYVAYKKKTAHENGLELSEKLNPEI